VKKLIGRKELDQVERYQAHVMSQAVEIIKHRDISCIFTTPRLLASIGERISIADHGIKGCFCGGTSMTPEYVRFLQEEVLENKGSVCSYLRKYSHGARSLDSERASAE
jgi:hypothetical protein